MMEMKKYKLSEIASFIGSGMTPLRSNEKYWNSKDYPWLKTEQLGEYQIFDTNEYISKVALEETNLKLFPKNTLSVAMYGEGKTRGNVSILAEQMTTNQACCNIIVDNKFANYKFVYYWLKNSYYKLRSLSSGIRNNLNSEDIKKFEINLPSLPTQQKIAAILSSLDDKIALNKKINAKLEAMAKRLYDYWFVQFDFPNEEGKPYKSSGGKMEYNATLKRDIPAGWEAVQIQSILDKHPSTKRYNTSEYLHEGKYPIVDQDSSTFIAGYTNEDDELLRRFPAVLFGDHSMCVKFLNFEFCRGADGTQILYSNDDRIKPYYLYLVVKSLTIPNQGYSRHFKYLKELPVILPSLELAAKFQEIVKPIYEKKTKCDKQIEKLSRLRDRLLPLLMNGQVEVEG